MDEDAYVINFIKIKQYLIKCVEHTSRLKTQNKINKKLQIREH